MLVVTADASRISVKTTQEPVEIHHRTISAAFPPRVDSDRAASAPHNMAWGGSYSATAGPHTLAGSCSRPGSLARYPSNPDFGPLWKSCAIPGRPEMPTFVVQLLYRTAGFYE